jgi:probable pyridine nucleotide-disulfide oxidoreductase
MKNYDAIIIGFGKAGKTLALELANRHWKVAVIEKNEQMYGGTCINIACIPTKILVHDSLANIPYADAIVRKDEVVGKLREKNYKNLADHTYIDVFNSLAMFRSDKEVEIEVEGKVHVLTAKHIFINTGATSIIPPLEGDLDSDKIYTSTTLIERKELPKRLAIVGGGYIGLEFASMYRNFGSEVIVISPDDAIMPDEDEDIVKEVQQVMEDKGIQFIFGARAEKVKEDGAERITLTLSNEETVKADAVLIATGRKPNIEGLGLENTSIELNENGGIKVNDHLETTVSNVWAMGDVRGGMQFTYISLDDFRVVKSSLFEDGKYTLEDRKHVPYSMFIDPVFSKVGLTAKAAKEQGYEILEGKLPVSEHPRAHVINDLRGLFKVVVDKKTNQILGATLFGPSSEELINLIKLAMDAKLSYMFLRDQIYNHPVMSEVFNSLFAIDES